MLLNKENENNNIENGENQSKKRTVSGFQGEQTMFDENMQ
jgi:hypothetical protein